MEKTLSNILSPRKALNDAYLKEKPGRKEIELFKSNLIHLLDQIIESETEEFHKNIISRFLYDTWYKDNHYINTKGKNDLVIHNDKNANSSVGVILETKSPSNRSEMIQKDKLNTKAFRELLLYYLRERITNNNLEIKHLIATNIYEWFIFDVHQFEKFFAQNRELVKQFNEFESARMSGKTTDFFYSEIAAPIIDKVKNELKFTCFDIRDYEEFLRNNIAEDDNRLIALYKVLSPEHLLKLPFANDSNSLDKEFYAELLHIIGLTEVKSGNKKVIERKKEKERNYGTLLENTIIQLDTMDKLSYVNQVSRFGDTKNEKLFNLALELVITWVNRILFTKLLEAQLVSYHHGDKNYAFLNVKKLNTFDDINSLFFSVLAKKHEERNEFVRKEFANIPYLNSSLFEPTKIEQEAIIISNLRNDRKIPLYSATVLKEKNGRRLSGEMNTLEYLLAFLDAYDFSSEGSEEIQEENKSLINASVLGLIFEKINGYKDGSYFTPGFITMYMCRETIRRAVVEKMNFHLGTQGHVFLNGNSPIKDCFDFEDRIQKSTEARQWANDVVNSLKICDPAVGSGHFLVSALNEIIAIKNDMGILQDRTGKRISRYEAKVVNDELIITDHETDELFDYKVNIKDGRINVIPEKQKLQEALFHEKQTIIENCLFGVDINPNSVKICRLRLWIELLKNAYYRIPENGRIAAGEQPDLETLPNIDINIKEGNSLISRFAIEEDLSRALNKNKWTIDMYKIAVSNYRRSKSRIEKREFEKLIDKIKQDFRTEISRNSKEQRQLDKLGAELYNRFTGNRVIEVEMTPAQKKKLDAEQKKITSKIELLEAKIEAIKNNKIYENAFEWRFEFPEVLNDDGDFLGFDVVIGNPPYIDIKAISSEQAKYYFSTFSTTSNRINLYSIFIELGYKILCQKGNFVFINPNSMLVNSSYQKIRSLILKEVHSIVKLPDKVFPDAIVETIILAFQKNEEFDSIKVIRYRNDEKIEKINNELEYKVKKSIWELFDDIKFNIYLTDEIQRVIKKCHSNVLPLVEIADFSLGITPYDKYKGHSQKTIKNREFHSHEKKDVTYKPLIEGENITRYIVKESVKEYIKYGKWLGAPREVKFFTKPRVIVRQIVSGKPPRIYAAYTDKPLYFTQIGFAIIPFKHITAKALTVLLNSKLINFIHKYLYLDIEKELFQKILIENCKKFPIKMLPKTAQDDLEKEVDKIIENNIIISNEIEFKLDQIIYELYGLNEDEIKIIENKTNQ